MRYIDHEFVAPISNIGLSPMEERFRDTILVCEHGTRVLQTPRSQYRVLRDGNHAKGALGNVVLLASRNPDYNMPHRGWSTIPYAQASSDEKSAIKRLMGAFDLRKPEIVTRLAIEKEGSTMYYSYFVFAQDEIAETGIVDNDFNVYIKKRFPDLNSSPYSTANKQAIARYGTGKTHGIHAERYLKFWQDVYESWAAE